MADIDRTRDKTLAEECARRLRAQDIFCEVETRDSYPSKEYSIRAIVDGQSIQASLEQAFAGVALPLGWTAAQWKEQMDELRERDRQRAAGHR